MFNKKYMELAIELAKKSQTLSEVPVGAVIVKNNEIIATGINRRETNKNTIFHAEIDAICNACNIINDWRLTDCDLYVTLEPCPMCAGAIINARIKRVYFGAYDKAMGCVGSVTNLFEMDFDCKPDYFGGIMEEECNALLSDFFKNIR